MTEAPKLAISNKNITKAQLIPAARGKSDGNKHPSQHGSLSHTYQGIVDVKPAPVNVRASMQMSQSQNQTQATPQIVKAKQDDSNNVYTHMAPQADRLRSYSSMGNEHRQQKDEPLGNMPPRSSSSLIQKSLTNSITVSHAPAD